MILKRSLLRMTARKCRNDSPLALDRGHMGTLWAGQGFVSPAFIAFSAAAKLYCQLLYQQHSSNSRLFSQNICKVSSQIVNLPRLSQIRTNSGGRKNGIKIFVLKVFPLVDVVTFSLSAINRCHCHITFCFKLLFSS